MRRRTSYGGRFRRRRTGRGQRTVRGGFAWCRAVSHAAALHAPGAAQGNGAADCTGRQADGADAARGGSGNPAKRGRFMSGGTSPRFAALWVRLSPGSERRTGRGQRIERGGLAWCCAVSHAVALHAPGAVQGCATACLHLSACRLRLRLATARGCVTGREAAKRGRLMSGGSVSSAAGSPVTVRCLVLRRYTRQRRHRLARRGGETQQKQWRQAEKRQNVLQGVSGLGVKTAIWGVF